MLLNIVKVKLWGNVVHYCADETLGPTLAALTGQPALHEPQLMALEKLGFTLVVGEAIERPAWVRRQYPSPSRYFR